MSQTTLHPYIRPTNKKYGADGNGGFWGENGYNCIEVGYIEVGHDEGLVSVIELTDCADVLDMGRLMELESNMQIAIDCIGDGYLRLFTRMPNRTVRWAHEAMPLSSMSLMYGTPMEEINAKEN